MININIKADLVIISIGNIPQVLTVVRPNSSDIHGIVDIGSVKIIIFKSIIINHLEGLFPVILLVEENKRPLIFCVSCRGTWLALVLKIIQQIPRFSL